MLNAKRINYFCIYTLSVLLVITILDSFYGGIIIQKQRGLSPLSVIIIEGFIINVILIILLNNKKWYQLSYFYLLITLTYGFLTAINWEMNNPFYWLNKGDLQAFIGISAWILELILSCIGLITWLILRFPNITTKYSKL